MKTIGLIMEPKKAPNSPAKKGKKPATKSAEPALMPAPDEEKK